MNKACAPKRFCGKSTIRAFYGNSDTGFSKFWVSDGILFMRYASVSITTKISWNIPGNKALATSIRGLFFLSAIPFY